MSKYKFYKNKRTKYHPSIQIDFDKFTWKNMELTSSPSKNGDILNLELILVETKRKRLLENTSEPT